MLSNWHQVPLGIKYHWDGQYSHCDRLCESEVQGEERQPALLIVTPVAALERREFEH
jgi:hypothetical protein